MWNGYLLFELFHILTGHNIIAYMLPLLLLPFVSGCFGSISSQDREGKFHGRFVDESPGFKKAADILLSSINDTVDPCENFFEFACGKWVANNPIPADLTSFGHFASLREKVGKQMKDLLATDENSTSTAITNLRRIYTACMDTDALTRKRATEMISAIKTLGYWPMINGDLWCRECFDLSDLLIDVASARSVDAFFDIYISPDMRNVSRRLIHIDQGSVGLGSRDYYLNQTTYKKQISAYRSYMMAKARLISEDAQVAINEDVLQQQVDDLLALETKLARIMTPEDERRNFTKMYNLRKIKDLEELLPVLNWDKYFRSLMPYDMHDYLNSNPTIIINEPSWLVKLNDLLTNTDPKTLTNYVIWRYTGAWSLQLDERFDNIYQDFVRQLTGKQEKSPRWKDCSGAASGRMSYAGGALYVRKYFEKSDKATALEMIEDLHTVFRQMVNTSQWMQTETKKLALVKAKEMLSLIGYPDWIANDTALDEYYELLELTDQDSYPKIIEKLTQWGQQRAFRKLIEPVDRSEFGVSSAVVNAFYSSLKNAITFPAAILQAPFFDRGFPKSMNYGGIGSVIGHEITHGFDDQGSQFDGTGNLQNWWDPLTAMQFFNRTQCIVEQYGAYDVPGTGLKVNGRLTQGENIADNGGIKEAFKAYRRHVNKLGHEEARLPGMAAYTHDQVFYLSYAQAWCGHSKVESVIRSVLSDPHSPVLFRVNGVVANQPEFSTAFRCPIGTPMNPVKKCTVW